MKHMPERRAKGRCPPLRVRIKRVSARRNRFATFFGGLLVQLTDSGFEGGRAGRAGWAANVCRTNKRRFAAITLLTGAT